MSRTPTPDELRQVYAELKRQGLSRYDYDELLRIDSQGRLLMATDVADASKAACQAIRDQFKQLASFQIVAVNHKITGDNWLQKSISKQNGPYIWALYLEIDDGNDHEDLFLDGYDAVSKHIPYLDEILRVAHLNGVDVNRQNVHADIRGKQSSGISECDGGGAAAGGDAGGASAGGDAGAIDAGDTAGEMAGTSTADVLGTFDPKKGVMGVGNFMVPSKAKVPLHRWEVCNGGSKRKKDKKGKDKKYAYEKGMKVVVSMFEDDEEMPIEPLEPVKQNIDGMWEYYEENANTNDLEDYVHANTMAIQKLKAKLQTSSTDLDDAVTFDPDEDTGNAFYGFKKYFKTRQDAVSFALKRIHDERLAWEDDSLTYAGEWTEDDEAYYDNQYETACKEIQSRGYASFDDGRSEVWHCEVNKVK